MEKLTNKILKKIILLSVVILLIVGFFSFYFIKNIYIEQSKQELKNYINLIELNLQKEKNYQKLSKTTKKLLNIRLTIVASDGKVLADSDANILKMDNHKTRPEINQLQTSLYGYSIRRSKTLNLDLIYFAKKIKIENKTLFIRVAKSLEIVYNIFLNIAIKMFIFYILFLAIFVYMVYKISDEISEETDKILKYLKELIKQKDTIDVESKYSLEFNKITNLLSKVSKELMQKQKKKAKYTAKLKLANKQKDEIISAISHEFKNPISVISGYSQTLIEDKNINPKIKDKFLAKIYTNTKKLTFLIDRLRMFTKLEDDNHPIKLETTDIAVLVTEIIEELKNSFCSKDIVFDIKDEVIKEIDIALFSVAVTNLIENALKYSEDEVIIKLDKNSLSVIDKGIGIKPSEIEKITQKFYRVSKNSWNNSLGIGLSIVSHIIRVHNFTLVIESKEFEGSIFSIKF